MNWIISAACLLLVATGAIGGVWQFAAIGGFLCGGFFERAWSESFPDRFK